MAQAPGDDARILETLNAFYQQIGQAFEVSDVVPPAALAAQAPEDAGALGRVRLRPDFQNSIGTAHADVASTNPSPLFQAAQHGDASQLHSLLLTLGQDEIDAQDVEGRTPLHVAALHDRLEVARHLLQAGASMEVQDSTEFAPLHWAAVRGCVPMIELLIAHGADVDASVPPPLFEAVCMGQVASVRALLAANATVSMPETVDASLLHEAVLSGEPEVVRMLIAAGCDVRAECDGLTPWDLAVGEGLAAVVQVLNDAEGDS